LRGFIISETVPERGVGAGVLFVVRAAVKLPHVLIVRLMGLIARKVEGLFVCCWTEGWIQ
jgi:hypothetical protein